MNNSNFKYSQLISADKKSDFQSKNKNLIIHFKNIQNQRIAYLIEKKRCIDQNQDHSLEKKRKII